MIQHIKTRAACVSDKVHAQGREPMKPSIVFKVSDMTQLVNELMRMARSLSISPKTCLGAVPDRSDYLLVQEK